MKSITKYVLIVALMISVAPVSYATLNSWTDWYHYDTGHDDSDCSGSVPATCHGICQDWDRYITYCSNSGSDCSYNDYMFDTIWGGGYDCHWLILNPVSGKCTCA